MSISSYLYLVPKSSNYEIDYVVVNLSFIPKDGFQEDVMNIETEPSGDIEDGNMIFRWDEPRGNELEFGLNSDVRSFNRILNVGSKIEFPLENLPDEVKKYTKPSDTIDSDNKDIIIVFFFVNTIFYLSLLSY